MEMLYLASRKVFNMVMEKESKKQSFEDMMNHLENISEEMSGEELSLEDAMKHYEEGVKLCNTLYKVLNEAEGKIKIITAEGEEDFKRKED